MASLTNRPRSHCKPPAFDDRYLADPYCRIKDAVSAVMLIAGVLFFCAALPAPWRAALNPFATSAQEQAASAPIGEDRTYSKPIGEVRVGDRVAGRNPIRGQAENIEPDPKTWRKVSLFIRKESGLGLWIELLRPLDWIEEYEAEPGKTILLELEEMGAFGDAEVTAISACPPIQPGEGTVVTGTFKHQADDDSEVIRLRLEDQVELTGVTTNHPYWSVDRRDFIAVGDLRIGEQVDTEYGVKRVLAITPIKHDGFLYNLETTEHVYRVGSLGTLVHNTCHAHHPLPKFLGGDKKQVLSRIDPKIHNEFHSVLRQNLRSAGISLNIGGKGGSAFDWARYMNLNKGSQRRAFDAVLKTSRSIDAKHGTNITQDVWNNLINRRFQDYQ